MGFVSGPFATPHCNEADGRQLSLSEQVVQKWTKAYSKDQSLQTRGFNFLLTAETESKELVQVIVARKRREMSAKLKYLAATYVALRKTLQPDYWKNPYYLFFYERSALI